MINIHYNTYIYIFLLLFSWRIAVLSFRKQPLMVLFMTFIVYIIFFLVLEYLEIYCGWHIWDQTERTVRCYEWLEIYLNNEERSYDEGNRFDYSESLFMDDYDTPIEQATLQKYNHIFSQLGLRPGMTLLDCGCGIGTWMDFCRQHGVDVIGLTLSEKQAEVIRNKGMTVHVQDYRKRIAGFEDRFDAITLLGCTEHVCSNRAFHSTAADRCRDSHTELYALLRTYLKKPSGRIFLTVLVLNPEAPYTSYDYLQAYILERHYGGYYIMLDHLRTALQDNGLKIESIEDKTRDYHWTSVVAPEHFGHWRVYWHKNFVLKLCTLMYGLLTDPFLIHHWLYNGMDTWMWQFGGYQNTPLTNEQVQTAPAQLKYVMISL